MKSTLLLATAFACSALTVNAADTINDILKDKTVSYTKAEEEQMKSSPKVEAFGYERGIYSKNGLLGTDFGVNADLGWNYELPLYNQDENLVFR